MRVPFMIVSLWVIGMVHGVAQNIDQSQNYDVPFTYQKESAIPKQEETPTMTQPADPGKSPFARFHKNWSQLTSKEKRVLMRQFLSTEPTSWISRDGKLPTTPYLAAAMNPNNREVIEDLFWFNTEKALALAVYQALEAIIQQEYQMTELRRQISDQERDRLRPSSQQVNQVALLKAMLKREEAKLKQYQQRYLKTFQRYQNFEGIVEFEPNPYESFGGSSSPQSSSSSEGAQ